MPYMAKNNHKEHGLENSKVVLEFSLHIYETNHSVFHWHVDAGHILLVVYVDE
jgi:hypothetical protein